MRLALLCVLAGRASAQVSAPVSVAITIQQGPREFEIVWSSGAGDPPKGYLYEIFRCTNIAEATDAGKCTSGYFLQQRDPATTYMDASACVSTRCPNSVAHCCSHTFHFERGWYLRFRVYAVDASDIPTVGYAQRQGVLMPRTAPDIVADLTSSAAPGDGRHRTFTWTVPRDNGHATLGYVLRRTTVGTGEVHDYNVTCVARRLLRMCPARERRPPARDTPRCNEARRDGHEGSAPSKATPRARADAGICACMCVCVCVCVCVCADAPRSNPVRFG